MGSRQVGTGMGGAGVGPRRKPLPPPDSGTLCLTIIYVALLQATELRADFKAAAIEREATHVSSTGRCLVRGRGFPQSDVVILLKCSAYLCPLPGVQTLEGGGGHGQMLRPLWAEARSGWRRVFTNGGHSGPQFPHLQNGNSDGTHLTGDSWRFGHHRMTCHPKQDSCSRPQWKLCAPLPLPQPSSTQQELVSKRGARPRLARVHLRRTRTPRLRVQAKLMGTPRGFVRGNQATQARRARLASSFQKRQRNKWQEMHSADAQEAVPAPALETRREREGRRGGARDEGRERGVPTCV